MIQRKTTESLNPRLLRKAYRTKTYSTGFHKQNSVSLIEELSRFKKQFGRLKKQGNRLKKRKFRRINEKQKLVEEKQELDEAVELMERKLNSLGRAQKNYLVSLGKAGRNLRRAVQARLNKDSDTEIKQRYRKKKEKELFLLKKEVFLRRSKQSIDLSKAKTKNLTKKRRIYNAVRDRRNQDKIKILENEVYHQAEIQKKYLQTKLGKLQNKFNTQAEFVSQEREAGRQFSKEKSLRNRRVSRVKKELFRKLKTKSTMEARIQNMKKLIGEYKSIYKGIKTSKMDLSALTSSGHGSHRRELRSRLKGYAHRSMSPREAQIGSGGRLGGGVAGVVHGSGYVHRGPGFDVNRGFSRTESWMDSPQQKSSNIRKGLRQTLNYSNSAEEDEFDSHRVIFDDSDSFLQYKRSKSKTYVQGNYRQKYYKKSLKGLKVGSRYNNNANNHKNPKLSTVNTSKKLSFEAGDRRLLPKNLGSQTFDSVIIPNEGVNLQPKITQNKTVDGHMYKKGLVHPTHEKRTNLMLTEADISLESKFKHDSDAGNSFNKSRKSSQPGSDQRKYMEYRVCGPELEGDNEYDVKLCGYWVETRADGGEKKPQKKISKRSTKKMIKTKNLMNLTT